MPVPDLLLLPHLVVGGTLLVAGVATLVRPSSAAAVAALGLSGRWRHPAVLRAHSLVEVGLGAGLLLLPHPAVLAPAVAALGLLTAYLLLVWRALARGVTAGCDCFGGLGSGRISRWTVARNAVLVTAAAVVVAQVLAGHSWAAAVPRWWTGLGLLAATAAAARLSARRPPAPPAELSGAATLVLLLSPTCGPCLHLSRRAGEFSAALPGIDLTVAETHPLAPDALQPAALVLDAGGRLLHGPVVGPEPIEALVTALSQVSRV